MYSGRSHFFNGVLCQRIQGERPTGKKITDSLFQRPNGDEQPELSIEDKQFLENMQSSFKNDPGGNWVVPLSFRANIDPSENSNQAMTGWGVVSKSLDTSLCKAPNTKRHMITFMKKYFIGACWNSSPIWPRRWTLVSLFVLSNKPMKLEGSFTLPPSTTAFRQNNLTLISLTSSSEFLILEGCSCETISRKCFTALRLTNLTVTTSHSYGMRTTTLNKCDRLQKERTGFWKLPVAAFDLNKTSGNFKQILNRDGRRASYIHPSENPACTVSKRTPQTQIVRICWTHLIPRPG